jgi:D-erythronate 2-dehydrogenase
MNIVITGGAGFLGLALAKTLLLANAIAGQTIRRITLLDRAPPPSTLCADSRVAVQTGDSFGRRRQFGMRGRL